MKFIMNVCAAAAAKLLQSCPTLCDPIDGSPLGSPIPGILNARTLEWVVISSSSAWKWKVKVKSLSRVRLLATPWTVAHQAPPSMGFSRQEYWSRVPLPSPCVCVCVCVCARSKDLTLCSPSRLFCGIYQARILKWDAISYSRVSCWPRDQICIPCISRSGRSLLYLCATWEARGLYKLFEPLISNEYI